MGPGAGGAERTALDTSPVTPFVRALGPALNAVAPALREHFAMPPGSRCYEGVMERVWRRHGLARLLSAPALRLAAAAGMLFPETGANIPFSLRHSLGTGTEGRAEMTWRRTFRFPNAVRSFSATMFYDSGRGCIVDLLGQTGTLEVDLFPFIDASGAVCLSSGRQYLRFGPVAVPVPRLLAGTAHAREWVCEDGRLGIEVVVKNPLLGGFFGYHGSLVHVPCD